MKNTLDNARLNMINNKKNKTNKQSLMIKLVFTAIIQNDKIY